MEEKVFMGHGLEWINERLTAEFRIIDLTGKYHESCLQA
jgi:hypothetical protein